MSFFEHESAFIWYCNHKDCDRFVAFKPHHFFDCVDELKARGWQFSPPSGHEEDDWSHYCPTHRGKRLADLLPMKFSEVK
jgi:hypothetical protein